MGQYHVTVNLDKKEFIHPHQLGAGLKLREQTEDSGGTGDALLVLLACSNGRGGGDFPDNEIVGRWAGDRIAIIGDYTENDDIPGVNTKEVWEDETSSYTNITHLLKPILEEITGVKFNGDSKTYPNDRGPKLVPDMMFSL